MNVLEVVAGRLEAMGALYALIGGRAVGARGYPRMTLDYDFLAADDRILSPEIWRPLAEIGIHSHPRKGDADDPVAGVVHLAFPNGAEADVLLAKWKWERDVIERAERLEIGGVRVPVPLTSDLILLKLAAGGPIDLQDVVALVETDRERWIAEVDGKVAGVQPSVSELWERVRDSL